MQVEQVKQFRLEWHVGKAPGFGAWIDDTPLIREATEDAVVSMNRQYGAGTHWLADRIKPTA